MRRHKIAFILTVISALWLLSCSTGHRHSPAAEYIPKAPDYADTTLWVTVDGDPEGTGADVFYIVSTWEVDWLTEDSVVSHYADVWNPVHRGHMAIEINKVAAYMSPGNRFYAPYYRHTTIDAWVTRDEDTIQQRLRLPMADVCAAFDRFQAQRDQTRPLVIAGFSQGGIAVVELLKHMDDATYGQLAAAYVLGYKVTEADLAQCSHIRPAERASDIGVTICYNTVKDVKHIKPYIAASDICINPVNWRTDDTPAMLHDSITVTLSPEHHVLVVSGYSGSEYPPYRDIINVGDIHSCEPWLYSECLQENINVRAHEWRRQHQSDIPRVILDTDVVSSTDDLFALELLDHYEKNGQCSLLGVVVNREGESGAAVVDVMNTFFGRPDVPIGLVRNGISSPQVWIDYSAMPAYADDSGKPLFRRYVSDYSSLPDGWQLYRRLLAAQPDHSVSICSVGFVTSLSQLLLSGADAYSPLNGVELVRQKVKCLYIMGGVFGESVEPDFNFAQGITFARDFFRLWPQDVDMVFSPMEVGQGIEYKPEDVIADISCTDSHPIKQVYLRCNCNTGQMMWDPMAVIEAVEGDSIFSLSERGTVSFTSKAETIFTPSATGNCRYQLPGTEAWNAAMLERIRNATKTTGPFSSRL
ncbi:MAG: DUF3089 domain-containing protein [Bacteroidales bacterium]|nr:DUF3089 domain-containing protein [Bacteroidales bacterium]